MIYSDGYRTYALDFANSTIKYLCKLKYEIIGLFEKEDVLYLFNKNCEVMKYCLNRDIVCSTQQYNVTTPATHNNVFFQNTLEPKCSRYVSVSRRNTDMLYESPAKSISLDDSLLKNAIFSVTSDVEISVLAFELGSPRFHKYPVRAGDSKLLKMPIIDTYRLREDLIILYTDNMSFQFDLKVLKIVQTMQSKCFAAVINIFFSPTQITASEDSINMENQIDSVLMMDSGRFCMNKFQTDSYRDTFFFNNSALAFCYSRDTNTVLCRKRISKAKEKIIQLPWYYYSTPSPPPKEIETFKSMINIAIDGIILFGYEADDQNIMIFSSSGKLYKLLLVDGADNSELEEISIGSKTEAKAIRGLMQKELKEYIYDSKSKTLLFLYKDGFLAFKNSLIKRFEYNNISVASFHFDKFTKMRISLKFLQYVLEERTGFTEPGLYLM